MNQMTIDRVHYIIGYVMGLDELHGQSVPGRHCETAKIRFIQNDPAWSVTLTPAKRIAFGLLTQSQAGERYFDEPESIMIELKVRNERVLAANLIGDDIEIYYHKPGMWECWLGLEPNTSMTLHTSEIYPDPKCPKWQAFLKSEDYRRGPLRIEYRDNSPLPLLTAKPRKITRGYAYSS